MNDSARKGGRSRSILTQYRLTAALELCAIIAIVPYHSLAVGALCGALAVGAYFLLERPEARRQVPLRAHSTDTAHRPSAPASSATGLSLEQYQDIAHNLAAALLLWDRERRLIFCSPYTEVLTGYSRREIYEHGPDFFNVIIHEEDRPLLDRAMKIAAYGEAFQVRFRFYHRSGLEMWAEMRTVPLPEPSAAGAVSVMFDITGAALYQRQVESMNRDLKDFSYMVSHDLKAPISTIKGMVQIINDECRANQSKDCSDALEHIDGALRRVDQLIASIIEYAKISVSEPEKESVNLGEVISDIKNDFEPQFNAVQGTLSFSIENRTLFSERIWLYRIIGNLLSNSLKYREPSRPLQAIVAVRLSRDQRRIIIEVSDNGIGIPKDKLDRVFRPFVRVHNHAIEGAGIGLAAVQRLIEKLGGTIEVRSVEHESSTFTMKFPTNG